jgi:hypothetical protein
MLQKYAAIYHKDITHVLNDVRREMLLLLKINEFIRNIDRRMGFPLDTYQNMVNLINVDEIYLREPSEAQKLLNLGKIIYQLRIL